MRSRRAMYWTDSGRVYRLTRREQESGCAVCPKCKKEMEAQRFTKSEKLFACPECGFKIPTGKTVKQRIEIEVDVDGSVEVGIEPMSDRESAMDNKRVAKELTVAARLLVGFDEIKLDDWDKMDMRHLVKFVKDRGGRVSPWQPGQGWKYVMEFKNFMVTMPNGGHFIGEDSASCILLAVFMLGEKAGIDAEAIYKKSTGDNLKASDLNDWMLLAKIPMTSDSRTWRILLGDLTDINEHTFRGDLEEALQAKGIL